MGFKETTVLSLLNKKKSYKAREVEAWLDNGPAQILICEQMRKPDNSTTIMKISRRMLGFRADQFEEYNIDSNFLMKP